MKDRSSERTWGALVAAGDEPSTRFDVTTTNGLPAPAQRFLARTLPNAAPLVSVVELTMEGEIKLGPRWFPFVANQIIRAGVGFVWRPVVGGRIMRFTGSDALGPDGAAMAFRFQGLVPVARSSGTDTTRSARGRLAAETVAWLPQALTPQLGASWRPVDGERAVVTVATGGDPIDVELTIAEDGRLRELSLPRWQDSAKPPRFTSFGGVVTDEHVTPDGLRIAGAGVVGWEWQTDDRSSGEFFRYTITSST